MKLEPFLFINGLYLLFTVPIFAMIYLIFRFFIKTKTYNAVDLFFALGGMVYYIIDLMNGKIHFASFKTMGNTVTELEIIALIYSALFLKRSIAGKYKPEKSMKYSWSILLLYILVAIIVFVAMPTIQE